MTEDAAVDYEQIRYEVDDPVATITLNRPEALNAWTQLMEAEVRHALVRATDDERVVAIVLTGEGRGFCAGADLNMLSGIARGEGAASIPEHLAGVEPGEAAWGDDLRGSFTSFLSVPKPIIAAINGAVAGMAVPIALCCDLRFASDRAVFTTSFSQRGLIAEWGSSWLLPRLVGPGHALDLLFSARKVGAEEAASIGLVNRVLPHDELVPFVRTYVEDLAENASPASMATMKRQVYQQLHAGLGPAEKEAVALMFDTFRQPDFAEGVSAFLERRPPAFRRYARGE